MDKGTNFLFFLLSSAELEHFSYLAVERTTQSSSPARRDSFNADPGGDCRGGRSSYVGLPRRGLFQGFRHVAFLMSEKSEYQISFAPPIEFDVP